MIDTTNEVLALTEKRDQQLISSLEKLYPVIWFGFITNAVTGVAIFTKDASTYGNNADFYIKLAFVALAMWLMMIIRTTAAAVADAKRVGDSAGLTVPPRLI